MGAAGILQTVKGEGKVFVIVWALPSDRPLLRLCVSAFLSLIFPLCSFLMPFSTALFPSRSFQSSEVGSWCHVFGIYYGGRPGWQSGLGNQC